jgi:hypothetical protein
MLGKSEEAVIVDYAFQSAEHLQIALAITYGCKQEIRRKIITDFLPALEGALREAFPGWRLENALIPDVFAPWRGITLSPETWADGYAIALEVNRWATSVYVGIKKPPEVQPIGDGSFKTQIDQRYRPGMTQDGWEWYQWISDRYGNWDNAETLLKLYEKGEAAAYYAGQLSQLAAIASPMLEHALASKEV